MELIFFYKIQYARDLSVQYFFIFDFHLLKAPDGLRLAVPALIELIPKKPKVIILPSAFGV